jgi:hypothetical protein
MNSLIQQLFMVRDFSDAVIEFNGPVQDDVVKEL